ncbi:uncharacterized protein LOC124372024 [Homalodisca vitripennis]|uniref:uncharacterized protein LOC124372024 n=1 Tax=Homalodisca vitripennis TaxID=197043 RepID=UPI001EE9E5FA|nr:uncharacterized protein LOC124372024 [Homalodisca vitripennis]
MNDISDVIDSKFQVFADDMVFNGVGSLEDCLRLQDSLDRICNWCIVNGMQLNASICKVISFQRENSLRPTQYQINGTLIQHSDVIKDLGVLLNNKFSRDNHIDSICSRASRLLGFMWCGAIGGLSVYSIVILYKSLLRPILEYASVVWKPFYTHHIVRLERVQRRFLRLVGARLGFNFPDVPIKNFISQFEIFSLQARFDLHDIMFLFKIINGIINCPELLGEIGFRTPSSTRSTDLFVHNFYRTNYMRSGTIARLHHLGNYHSG